MLSDARTVPTCLEAMASLHHRVHEHRLSALPSLKGKLAQNIGRAPHLPESVRQSLLDRLTGMPDGDRLCHGDFHPFNIIGTPDDAIVIDWLDASSGAPAADVCRSYVLMHHIDATLAEDYVRAYEKSSGPGSPDALAWLPFVAAARLAEGVAEEADTLLEMARSRP
jgi:aminoglycoside phosphotransferase (APT) family kinase protein